VGLIHILGEMEKADPPPGGEMSKYAPQIETLTVSKKYIGRVIGKGGEQIKSICEQTKIDTIDINDDGVVVLSGGFGCDMASAVAIVESLTVEAEVGKTYRGARVTKVLDFGAFVEVLPGIEGLCHVSELDVTRVNNPKDVVNEGDRIDVKLLETNERGQLKLSRREVLLDEGGDEARAQLEEAKQAREEARDARKAEAEGGAQSEDGGWGEDRGGGNPDDRRRGRPPPKARRGRTRLRE
jgi:polyribonucleotide nucleotidyltransferase